MVDNAELIEQVVIVSRTLIAEREAEPFPARRLAVRPVCDRHLRFVQRGGAVDLRSRGIVYVQVQRIVISLICRVAVAVFHEGHEPQFAVRVIWVVRKVERFPARRRTVFQVIEHGRGVELALRFRRDRIRHPADRRREREHEREQYRCQTFHPLPSLKNNMWRIQRDPFGFRVYTEVNFRFFAVRESDLEQKIVR